MMSCFEMPGRIINVHPVKVGLLYIPVLFLSRQTVRIERDYCRVLQVCGSTMRWEEWVIYRLGADSAAAGSSSKALRSIERNALEYDVCSRAAAALIA